MSSSPNVDVSAILADLSEQQLQSLVRLAKQTADRKRHPFFDRLDRARMEIKGSEAFITSLGDESQESPAGVVFMATKEIAARHIAMRTHRLSTDDEITAYQEQFYRRTEESRSRHKTQEALENASRELASMEPVPAARRPQSKKGD